VSGFGLTPEEGSDIFDRMLASVGEVGQVVVSTGSLQDRLDQWVIRPAARDATADGTARPGPRDPRPPLPTPYVRPADGAESALADIWADVLGLDRVGAEDDFYRLGGDSITAIDLTARMRKRLQVALPVTALLENPSVRQLAVKIAALSAGTA
jgi:phthiocerol/phenolphthiocerol synthesis type-I polyketide synthase E